MGSPPSEEGHKEDERQHRVTLTRGFYLGTYAVTQAQWKAVMGGNNPSRFPGDDLPVENVSWKDAKAFCDNLSAKECRRYELPTEAEWEYACRAGTPTPFHFGDTLSTDWANHDGAFTDGQGQKRAYRQKTTPVGAFNVPNAWGLHDLHGNVWEWCADWYADYPDGDSTDPKGPEKGEARVLRGGSWYNYPQRCRSAARNGRAPGYRRAYSGFRVCLHVD